MVAWDASWLPRATPPAGVCSHWARIAKDCVFSCPGEKSPAPVDSLIGILIKKLPPRALVLLLFSPRCLFHFAGTAALFFPAFCHRCTWMFPPPGRAHHPGSVAKLRLVCVAPEWHFLFFCCDLRELLWLRETRISLTSPFRKKLC